MSARFGFPTLAGPAPDAAAALPIGSQIEAHTVLQVLSESRYGFVYLTRDDVLGATRVLKEFMPRSRLLRLSDGSVRPCDVSDSIATSVARIAFMNEANALAAVQHPCLVHVFGTIPAHRTLYRVMPLVDGVSLEQHCRSRAEPPTLAWVAGLVDNLLQAVQALHERGFAHGCVQPQQVMVRESGQALLLGFASVARELDNAPSAPWQSPAAPQLTRHAPPSQADDFPALAETAYFAATGLTAPTPQQRSAGAVLDLRQALSCLPDGAGDTPQRRRGLIQALESGLSRAAESRPQSVAEFRRLLAGDVPLRAVATEPAPRWVGVVPQRRGEDVDALISQPAPLDDAGTALRLAAAAFAVPAPVPVTVREAAPMAASAAAAADTPIAARAPVPAAVSVAAPLAAAPIAAAASARASSATAPGAAATATAVAAAPSSPWAPTAPLGATPIAAGPFDRIEPSWPAPDRQRNVPVEAPVKTSASDAPDLPLAFDAADIPVPQVSRLNLADIAAPDTEPFVASLAPRRETRWQSRALAATLLVAAGVAAAWWYTSTPTGDPVALGTPMTPSSATEAAAAAATPVPARPVQPGALVAPAESTARAANTPAADTAPAITVPAADAGTSPVGAPATVVAPATVAAAPPTTDVAPAEVAAAAVAPPPALLTQPAAAEPTREMAAAAKPAALSTANPNEARSTGAGRTTAAAPSAAQRSANATPRTGTATASRSGSAVPRPAAARGGSVAGSAGTKPEVRLRSPLAMCGNRTQFSLVYCLQQQCARTQYRAHPQCIEVRNGG